MNSRSRDSLSRRAAAACARGDVDERGHQAAAIGQPGDFHHAAGAVLGGHREFLRFRHGMVPERLRHGGVPGRHDFLPVAFVGIGLAPPIGDRGDVRRGIPEHLGAAPVDQGNGAVAFDQAGGHR